MRHAWVWNRSITVGRVERHELDLELTKARAGLCLSRGDRSAAAVSPTKIAEYLAAGLPVVASAGIGDTDEILANQHALLRRGRDASTGRRACR